MKQEPAVRGETANAGSASSSFSESSSSFSESLTSAATNVRAVGNGSSAASGVEVRSNRKAESKDARGESSQKDAPVATSALVAASLPLPLPVAEMAVPPQSVPQQTVALRLSALPLSALPLNSEALAAISADSTVKTATLSDSALPTLLESAVAASAGVMSLASGGLSSASGSSSAAGTAAVAPVLSTSDADAQSAQSATAGSAAGSAEGLVSPQRLAVDAARDPILSAIHAAVFAAPAVPAVEAHASSPRLVAASSSHAVAATPTAATATTLSAVHGTVPAGVATVESSLSKLQRPESRGKLARVDAPSSAAVGTGKGDVAAATPPRRETEDASSSEKKEDAGSSSDPDAAQKGDGVFALNEGGAAAAQVPTVAPAVASEPALPAAISAVLTSAAPALAGAAPNAGAAVAAAPREAHTAPAAPAGDASLALNSVKLTQRVNQAEMTIGMHSAEFGSISIRTSTVKDVVAAEVSLDHAELSKALLSHLPEMQSRVNGDRPLELRITNTGAGEGGTGQGGYSGDTSPGGQQAARGSSQRGANRFAATQQPLPLAVTLTDGARTTTSSNRLDVRA